MVFSKRLINITKPQDKKRKLSLKNKRKEEGKLNYTVTNQKVTKNICASTYM